MGRHAAPRGRSWAAPVPVLHAEPEPPPTPEKTPSSVTGWTADGWVRGLLRPRDRSERADD